jgi:asparagine synthase (glutamine-hydrolysing)
MDPMAMASSLEVRSPLLDQKVIEFAAGLLPDLKLHQGTSKYLLKRYAEQRVPATAIHRPKMGFSIPLAAWLRGGLRDMAADLLLSERARGRGYFHPPRVRATLMMLELWHRQFLDGGA